MTNTISKQQFSSGKGKMTYNTFAHYADEAGIQQAIWIAKHFGIALTLVKSFVSIYNGYNKGRTI